ncbi:MAG TPA: extracellular solute-binding protein [Stellaceae bacterium]|jgi:iron(III) transport system substrate-binding protein|nr:extracellular solute-binding protein [Stellaceae bacterium]
MFGKRRLWLAAACLVAARLVLAAVPAGAAPVSDADWEKIVAAAKLEGKVVISHFTDAGMEPVLRDFEQAYGIRVEASPGRPDAVIPKILTEQQSGQFNWDVLLQPVNNVRLVLEPAHGLEPILPFLVRADVADDAAWYGGVTAQVPMDPLYVFYDGISNLAVGIDVDRDKVPASAVNDWPDLLKPEWKGKFAIYYPGRPANLTIALTCYRPAFDSDAAWEDYVRGFFAQQPIASPEFRTVTDWLMQGRFAVVVGAEGSYLDGLKDKLKRKIEAPVGRNLCGFPPTGTGRSVSIPKNPPDRNAATVFVNWYLSKAAQDALVRDYTATGERSVSRRKDAAHPDPDFQQATLAGFAAGWLQGKGLMTDSDEGLRLQRKVIEIARQAGY